MPPPTTRRPPRRSLCARPHAPACAPASARRRPSPWVATDRACANALRATHRRRRLLLVRPHCRYLGINASARASAYIYNTPQEVDAFVEALTDTIKFFKEL